MEGVSSISVQEAFRLLFQYISVELNFIDQNSGEEIHEWSKTFTKHKMFINTLKMCDLSAVVSQK